MWTISFSGAQQSRILLFVLHLCLCVYIYTHVHSLSAYCPREGTHKPLFGYEHNLTFQIQHYPWELCAQEMSPTQKFLSNNSFYACVYSCSVIHLILSRKMNVLSTMHFPVRTNQSILLSNSYSQKLILILSWITYWEPQDLHC